MKTMMFSDFLSIRRSLPQSILVALIVAVVCTLFGGITFSGAAVCAMMPITIVFSMQLYDDQNDWSGYRLTLPVNRRQVVWGRYLFMALCATGAFLIGCAIVLASGLLGQSGILPQASIALSEASANAIVPFSEAVPIGVLGAYLSLLFVLLLLSITLPLLMRFGLTKAVRFVPVACCIVFLLAIAWLSDPGNGLLSWLDAAAVDSGMLWLLGTVLCFALYIASAAITTKLYASREF